MCDLKLFVPVQENTRVVTIDDFEDVPANSESSLKQAVSQQPVSVAIEADKRPFQFYRGVSCWPCRFNRLSAVGNSIRELLSECCCL